MYIQAVTSVLIHSHVQNSFSVITFYNKSPIYHKELCDTDITETWLRLQRQRLQIWLGLQVKDFRLDSDSKLKTREHLWVWIH